MSKINKSIVPDEIVIKKIVILREERVLLDVHLAELYGIETRTLKQAVKRNIERFPDDFMFTLNKGEMEQVVSQNVIPSISYFGGSKPYAFTETGVAMLSSVLRSERAVEMNIAIMRTFIALRKLAVNYKDLLVKLEELQKTYDHRFTEVYNTLEYLIGTQNKRRRIGFKTEEEE
jgi:hypothetical protein